MQQGQKYKKKPSGLIKAISDSQMQQTLLKTQKIISSNRSDMIDSVETGKDLVSTLKSPHKAKHYLNLQIPSINSPINSFGSQKNNPMSLKSVNHKSLKSPRATSLKKKKLLDSESTKILENDFYNIKNENILLDEANHEAEYLENELKRAIEENKKLKEKIYDDSANDSSIDEIMKNFRSRLYKLLYE